MSNIQEDKEMEIGDKIDARNVKLLLKKKRGRPRLERVTRVINGNTHQTKVKSAKRVE